MVLAEVQREKNRKKGSFVFIPSAFNKNYLSVIIVIVNEKFGVIN